MFGLGINLMIKLGINKQHWYRLKQKYFILRKVYKGINLISFLGIKQIKIIEKIFEIITYGRFDSYLKNTKGVIHIGASNGYERDMYKKYSVGKVLWIEADPDVFQVLKKNISKFDNNFAYNYLITDKDNSEYNFLVSSDSGQSSSIYNFKDQSQMYEDLKITKKILLNSITFKSFVKKNEIDLKQFSSLVIDTQGAEMDVLKGMDNLINNFKLIKIETAEFDLYENYPKISILSEYLKKFGFLEIRRIEVDLNEYNQKAYDVIFFNRNI